VGGTLGAFLTGVLATSSVNGNLTEANAYAKANGLYQLVGNGLWGEQVKAIFVTLILAVVGTTVIAYIIKATIGLRVDEEVETAGLDLSEHGEEGYHGV
jgi:Amt family ammonium transporter